MITFEITHYDDVTPARVGHLETRRGPVETPAFMPVGTRGVVKTATGREVWLTGARLMLANTYHLMLRPGAEVVAALGGVHAVSGFEGPMLTDSGGFQSLSLRPSMDDDGMTFRSVYDGTAVRLTPEEAMRVQGLLGADIATALDDCPALPATGERLEVAVERSARWARRCREAHRGDQAVFGIVQGGTDPDLRDRSAARVTSNGFDGYAVGGLSVGESVEEMAETLQRLEPSLPLDSPRYLMGVGDPVRILAGVEAGIDLFDSVWPTRLARHGHVLVDAGRTTIKAAARAGSSEPLDADCPCEACRSYPSGALRHLFLVKEPLAARLLTLHNLTWLGRFMAGVRSAIRERSLGDLAARVRSTWAPTAGSNIVVSSGGAPPSP